MTRRWKIALVALVFVALVVGAKACFELVDEGGPLVVDNGCCAGWKPCPGRKPVGKGRSRAVWWCGPEHPDLRKDENDAPRKSDKSRAPKGQSRGVGKRGQRPS